MGRLAIENSPGFSGPPAISRAELSELEYLPSGAQHQRILPDGMLHPLGAERFRALSQWLHDLRRKRPLQTLLVTSAVPKEGKTFVAVNVASVLARTSGPVLLVDGDLRGPRIDRVMGFPLMPGLANYLEGRDSLRSVIRRLDPPGLCYCSAGDKTTNPAELFQGAALAHFLEEASATFAWVIVDSPPVIPFVDARCIAGLVDGVLLVVRENATPKEELRQAVACLGESTLLGVILNGCESSRDTRYYSHYKNS